MEVGLPAKYFCCIRLALARRSAEVNTGKENGTDGFHLIDNRITPDSYDLSFYS